MSNVTDAICAWDRLTNNITNNEDDSNIDMTEAEADLDMIYQYLRKQNIRMKNIADGNEYLNREADRVEQFNAVTELRRQSNEGGK